MRVEVHTKKYIYVYGEMIIMSSDENMQVVYHKFILKVLKCCQWFSMDQIHDGYYTHTLNKGLGD